MFFEWWISGLKHQLRQVQSFGAAALAASPEAGVTRYGMWSYRYIV